MQVVCHRDPKDHEEVQAVKPGRQLLVFAAKVVSEKVVVEQVTAGQLVSSLLDEMQLQIHRASNDHRH